MQIILDSFKELFLTLKNFLISKKSYVISFVAFVVMFIVILVLSKTLTQISFLGSIDLTDPNNVADVQPLVDNQQRITGIISLIVVFFFITVTIGRRQGFGSFLSLILSGFTIYSLIIPLMLQGWNPLFVTVVFGGLILTASVLISHGFNIKTITSICAGLLTLVITLFIGELFRAWIQVSGYYGESTYNLLVVTQTNFNMPGIVLASIIMSGLGLLDDITLTQTSLTFELYRTDPKLTFLQLYRKAMNVGRDHIGALVNSLFFAYAAASLPLLMLMSYAELDLSGVINYEFFMEEILRTLVASVGLILSVPISTFIAAFALKRNLLKMKDLPIESESHAH